MAVLIRQSLAHSCGWPYTKYREAFHKKIKEEALKWSRRWKMGDRDEGGGGTGRGTFC